MKDLNFWVAVGIATLVKIRTSEKMSPIQVAISVVIAVGAAWVAHGYVAKLLGVPDAVAGALVALLAEGVMRWLIKATEDPQYLIEVIRAWRGDRRR